MPDVVRVPDATQSVPVRRMSVARGRLHLAAAAVEALRRDPSPLGAAKAAGLLAAKDHSRLVPTAVPVQLTDATCDFDLEAAQAVVTVTVQAHARVPLEGPALAATAAALLSLLDALGGTQACGGRLGAIEVVQNVTG